ncbi:MAG TPA: hypothetical protein PKB00_16480, partial [Microthrixaceae bacterium]|nr:hypothetical protein [Microthrixaceae bacterium]
MATNARIPNVDLTDPELRELQRLLAKVADRRSGETRTDFVMRSKAARDVFADVMWIDEQLRLEEAVTTAPEIVVEGEPYRKLAKQRSSVLVHGLWGAHRVEERLYRRAGLHNGPTIKPLVIKLGIVDGSLLPDLADEAGELLSKMTSRDVEATLLRQGFRPPSRTTLANRLGGMLSEIATGARELEDQCRMEDALDFEVGAISCGLDRFSARMDETLPEGPERTEKLRRRRPSHEYQRTPPEPHVSSWRMAWAANVTLYDTEGRARHSFRYGADAGHDVELLVARVVDDVCHLCERDASIPVACIQDGATDLEPLRRSLRERLPAATEIFELSDFHHAIGYLDAIIAARDDGDPTNMAGWYRIKLLSDDTGAQDIVEHLRRLADGADAHSDAVANAIHEALVYFAKRRPMMRYAEARELCLPIGSG